MGSHQNSGTEAHQGSFNDASVQKDSSLGYPDASATLLCQGNFANRNVKLVDESPEAAWTKKNASQSASWFGSKMQWAGFVGRGEGDAQDVAKAKAQEGTRT